MSSSVLFQEIPCQKGFAGKITLDRPSALNSLDLDMVMDIKKQLIEWAKEPDLTFIFLDSTTPKAFCAGGDVKTIVQKIRTQQDKSYGLSFFTQEYSLDLLLHQFPKPVVVWGQGLVMGGGLGLMAGGTHRIVTQSSLLAMPEISIGFFPDVGAGHFLQKIPRPLAMFLALTGARLSPHDALFVGWGNFFLDEFKKEDLLLKFNQIRGDMGSQSTSQQLNLILHSYSLPKSLGPLESGQNRVQQALGHSQYSQIFLALSQMASLGPWWAQCIETWEKGSAFSARCIHHMLENVYPYLNLQDAFAMDLHLAKRFLDHPDFIEGVRALLIDKDKQPKWRYQTWQEISEQEVSSFFSEKV